MSLLETPRTPTDYLALAKRPVDKRRLPLSELHKKKSACKNLQGRNREICRLHVMGFKNVEISELLNITPQTVSNVVNSPLAMEEMARMQADLDEVVTDSRRQIAALRGHAIRHYGDILTDKVDASNELKLRAANEVLDRVGASKKQEVTGAILHGHFGTAEIEEIKRRALEAHEEMKKTEAIELVSHSEAVQLPKGDEEDGSGPRK